MGGGSWEGVEECPSLVEAVQVGTLSPPSVSCCVCRAAGGNRCARSVRGEEGGVRRPAPPTACATGGLRGCGFEPSGPGKKMGDGRWAACFRPARSVSPLRLIEIRGLSNGLPNWVLEVQLVRPDGAGLRCPDGPWAGGPLGL